jgi:hypothetical protein
MVTVAIVLTSFVHPVGAQAELRNARSSVLPERSSSARRKTGNCTEEHYHRRLWIDQWKKGIEIRDQESGIRKPESGARCPRTGIRSREEG